MTSRSKYNPFQQSPHYWQIRFELPVAAVATAEEAFNDMALSVSNFETDEARSIWTFNLLFETPPDQEEITRRLAILAHVHAITTPAITCEELLPQDWLAQVASQFPPLSIGRFFVHGSHEQQTPHASSIAIEVDAGAAFGSGEHATTSGCLQALEWLAKRRAFDRILDVGCGSGILAIASAKLWNAAVVAVDIDPIAVRVTRENARNNRVKLITAAADGYACDAIRRSGKFDLILANILARPLIRLAPDLAGHLQPGGIAVLSGLLALQETQVLAAHRAQGLRLVRRFGQGEWMTLVLQR